MAERNALDRIIPWAYVVFLVALQVVFDVYGREGDTADVEGVRWAVRSVCWGGLIPLMVAPTLRGTAISSRDVGVIISQALLLVLSNSMTQFGVGTGFMRQCLHELSLVTTMGVLLITVVEGCIVEHNLVAYAASLGSVALCLYAGPKIYHEIQALGPWHYYYGTLIIETILITFHLSFFGRKPGTKVHRFNLMIILLLLPFVSELLHFAFNEFSGKHPNALDHLREVFVNKN